MIHSLPENYKFVRQLGAEKKRKFNRVSLIENIENELFVLKSGALSDERACSLLLQEFQFTFEEKSLPQVVVIDKTETDLLLILHYKNGIQLKEYWKNLNKKERSSFLQKFVPEFIELMQKVHEKGVFHNDIRPGNILIDGDNIHLIDFGMATRKGASASNKTLFSLAYASPELILNRLHLLDETSDYFSFGMLLIELISGEPLFTHENPSVLTNLSITYPIKLKGIVPKEMIELLEQMCFKTTFSTSPNRLQKEQLDEQLSRSQKQRKMNKEDFVQLWNKALNDYQLRRKNKRFSRFQIA